mmetsp:Transcript_11392/g.34359  ORF Transcript_11392/g.34359 Transcript_11392/m.34359 type:complete len:186 (-) Transcript_11392:3510-4067(-)
MTFSAIIKDPRCAHAYTASRTTDDEPCPTTRPILRFSYTSLARKSSCGIVCNRSFIPSASIHMPSRWNTVPPASKDFSRFSSSQAALTSMDKFVLPRRFIPLISMLEPPLLSRYAVLHGVLDGDYPCNVRQKDRLQPDSQQFCAWTLAARLREGKGVGGSERLSDSIMRTQMSHRRIVQHRPDVS